MQIDNQELHDHYAALSDEELLAIDPSELTEVAQRYYDAELAKRDFTPQEGEAEDDTAPGDLRSDEPIVPDNGPEPDWLEDAACAIAFRIVPGGTAAQEAGDAREALQAARVPCHISVTREEYCVMVPGVRNLEATSVLDREIFNPKEEDMWRAHFAQLPDEDFRALKFDVICAGIQDRLARLKKAYSDEMTQRGLK